MWTMWLIILLGSAPAWAHAPADDAMWQRLRGDKVIVLMRHATTTPGVGDPPGFALGDCATQRNLSERGRRDARAIGAAFRRHGIVPGAVWSSRWCRCLDTARLAFGEATPEPGLDSIFASSSAQAEATLRRLRTRLQERRDRALLVLVTHDVNIRALSGASLAPGAMLLTRWEDGKLVPFAQLSPASLNVAKTPQR